MQISHFAGIHENEGLSNKMNRAHRLQLVRISLCFAENEDQKSCYKYNQRPDHKRAMLWPAMAMLWPAMEVDFGSPNGLKNMIKGSKKNMLNQFNHHLCPMDLWLSSTTGDHTYHTSGNCGNGTS